MTVRVYIPFTRSGLARALEAGLIPGPMRAHAVTSALVAAWPEGDEEELEYAAMAAAAHSSWELRSATDVRRRHVIAADVATVVVIDDEDPTLVEVGGDVPWGRIAAAHVDLEDVTDADLEDADLAWHATQEIPGLVR